MSELAPKGLMEFVRAHRVHFDVEPEIVLDGPTRLKVGFQVTLWAVHDPVRCSPHRG